MTDRELLELAAKAAGLSAEWVDFAGMDIRVGYQGGMLCADGDSDYYWNPLKSDGDALRLAVAVGVAKTLVLEIGCGGVDCEFQHGNGQAFYSHEGDPRAAARRAIVRAAAKVGKSM